MLRATTTDHRNRRVPLVAYDLAIPFARNPDRSARFRAAAKLNRAPITGPELLRGLAYGLVAFPVMLACALAPSVLTFKLHAPWWALALAVVPLGLTPPLITVFIIRRAAADRIAGYYTAADYCASCGFDLKATEPQRDACRICPECSAAWRITSDLAP